MGARAKWLLVILITIIAGTYLYTGAPGYDHRKRASRAFERRKTQRITRGEHMLQRPVFIAPPVSMAPSPAKSNVPKVEIIDELPKKLADDDGDDMFVTTEVQRTSQKHHDDSPKGCKKWVTREMLEEFRTSKKQLCKFDIKLSNETIEGTVHQYIHKTLEYSPSVQLYHNAVGDNIYHGDLSTSCNKRSPFDYSSTPLKILEHPVYRSIRFDMVNPYEAHHAYVNAYFTLRFLKIDPATVQFVWRDNHFKSGNDHRFWKTISKGSPHEIRYMKNDVNPQDGRILFRTLIEGQSTGTSLLVTNNFGKEGSVLRGRATDHHCKSPILVEYTEFMRGRLGITIKTPTFAPIKVVWSSRVPYKHADGRIVQPRRHISDEPKMIEYLRTSLGERYTVTPINFGDITYEEILALMAETNILAGVHGAGLIYSMYLRPHSGLVEVFGGDRGPSNRHYHNIAAYMDLHYESYNAKALTRADGLKDATFRAIKTVGEKVVAGGEPA
eukprot:TRINITY_DN13533_c0_g2_i1.p1 TRINITY_DN13533_c0_g2~~TRINITY_DN13533_c0_g2_i1.p1  ORF type:complete len:498 (+),score=43.65 TRINITY_DN13533_c0_g2_i1:56-1549(+)